jgi:hypothetical protein
VRRTAGCQRVIGTAGAFARSISGTVGEMSDPDDVYKQARGKPLVLKGGLSLAKKAAPAVKKRKAADVDADGDGGPGPAGGGTGIGGAAGGPTNKNYEELFASEMARAQAGKGRTTAWGTNFRPAPEVLHGYSKKLDTSKPLSAEERLDIRASTKADKFCR